MKVVFVSRGLEVTPELRGYLLTRLRLALPRQDLPPRRATVYLWEGPATSGGATAPVRKVSTPSGPVPGRLEGYAKRVHCLVSISVARNHVLSAQGFGATATSAAHWAAVRLAEAAARDTAGAGAAPPPSQLS